MNADRRIASVRRKMTAEELPAFIVTDISNVRYMTGFENVWDDGANVACLVTSDRALVYTDSRYSEAVEEASVGTPWILKVPEETIYVELCQDMVEDHIDTVGLESSVPYGRFRFISEQFEGKVLVLDQWFEEIRQVKEAAEVERIATAAEITDRTFDRLLEFVRVGVRESEIALEIECFMRENGAEDVAFDPIVASGPNSSRPHARVTSREIEAGDFLTIDMGARVEGYCSDMTRTIVVGRADSKQREIYEAVLSSNMAGIEASRAGVPGADIDEAARRVLGEKALGQYFVHGLGHGVGLDVHELPSISKRGRESVLPGSVITIEPGVYIPGFGGVRIEDLVVIEEQGCRVLSKSPKHFMQIGTE